MTYTSKFLEHEKNLQKLLNIIDGHSAALEYFERVERIHHHLRNPYENLATVQNSCKNLLGFQGINKNLLGLQSIAEQMQSVKLPLQVMHGTYPMKTDFGFESPVIKAAMRAQEIFSSPILQALNQNAELLKQISKQTPFISEIQSRLARFERMTLDTVGIAAIKHSAPFMSSALAVATASINFSAELDTLPYSEQLRIVDFLDRINLDTDEELIIPENLSAETQADYISLTEVARNFWKKNNSHILVILTTVETVAENFSENDISNPLTIVAFIYSCIALLLN